MKVTSTIIFFSRGEIEIQELAEKARKLNFQTSIVSSLHSLIDALNRTSSIMIVIEDDLVTKSYVDQSLFYKILRLSKVPIQIVIGEKSKFQNTETLLLHIDDVIAQKSSFIRKQALFKEHLSVAQLILDLQKKEELKVGNTQENSQHQDRIQKKDRIISTLYLQVIKYKNLLQKNYIDWKALELPLQNPEVLSFHNSLRRNQLSTHKNWEELYTHFVQIHPSFFDTLRKHAENLTDENLKICTYIKIGLNNSDIAKQMGILESSVKRSQTRIKKKLGLGPEQTLRKFIQHLFIDTKALTL